MRKAKSFAAGFTLASLATGAAVLLSTPKSGAAIRTEATFKSKQAKSALQQIKAEGLHLKNDIRNLTKNVPVMKEAASDMKKTVDNWRTDIEPNVNSLNEKKENVQQTMTNLEKQMNKTEQSPQ